jgi:hypothetical protein
MMVGIDGEAEESDLTNEAEITEIVIKGEENLTAKVNKILCSC